MRASELVAAPVVDPEGRVRGQVIDIRTKVERAPNGSVLVVDGFIIGTHAWLFGYERPTEQRPLPIGWIVRLLHRNTRYAPWHDVELDEGRVLLRDRDWNQLPHLSDI